MLKNTDTIVLRIPYCFIFYIKCMVTSAKKHSSPFYMVSAEDIS